MKREIYCPDCGISVRTSAALALSQAVKRQDEVAVIELIDEKLVSKRGRLKVSCLCDRCNAELSPNDKAEAITLTHLGTECTYHGSTIIWR